MPLQNTNEIDVLSLNEETGVVSLGIIDSLSWDDEERHLLLLQEKLNVYLSFIESGEIYTSYEGSEGKEFEIKIFFKYQLPDSCKNFLNQVKEIISAAGFYFTYQIGA
ncbi:hypothetical protein WJ0W_002167 [Paenibacillus melissococcoides]|uniref:Branched-chain amino acid ABC transporter substrate-binding protein n=1 Tax=Paenibacillus melissococcoides TaxID=2912268 RepID=A0ABM9G035_9BACL|nr:MULTISPECIES: DUF6572 domain-containing protein [Paenibacillus]MEB9895498.1 hypothetical protein [Bacillus cereus]CAH8244937.1 hypothetical protein WJ0W_002167 [Paenibacillus melissococcoides]CAH8709419.1 hypothetical protein WDD9_002249 [Paenibacillus melissococcoides]CAH8710147.1 hypothetical protein HTL2_002536 [Paenibacillus melissococcoides]GIO82729.1 hypothetical protein J6TS7_63390 [Paenibacillus dendritiformis]